jgi:hypothetical protein
LWKEIDRRSIQNVDAQEEQRAQAGQPVQDEAELSGAETITRKAA